jgi:hypothetical protein
MLGLIAGQDDGVAENVFGKSVEVVQGKARCQVSGFTRRSALSLRVPFAVANGTKQSPSEAFHRP